MMTWNTSSRPLRIAALFLGLLAFAVAGCSEEDSPVPVAPISESEDMVRARTWADSILDSLSLDQKIGQLMLVEMPADMDSADMGLFSSLADAYGLGGVLLDGGGDRLEQKSQLEELRQRLRLPIWAGLDVDEKWAGVNELPSLLSLAATGVDTLARDYGMALGAECKFLGGQLLFLSCAKVNPSGNAFADGLGSDPLLVRVLGESLVEGVEAAGVIPVARSLPTPRDLGGSELPEIKDLEAWKNQGLQPIRTFVEEQIPAIQTAHLVFSTLDSMPVSLSHPIQHGLLRGQWAYEGLVFSPSFSDSLFSDRFLPGEAEALALAAGTDVLVSPSEMLATIDATKKLLGDGLLTQADLEERVRKVLIQKALLGLDTASATSPAFSHASPMLALHGLDRKITESSLTVLRDDPGRLPLKKVHDVKIATLSLGAGRKTDFQRSTDDFAEVDHFVLGAKAEASAYEAQAARLGKYNYVAVSVHPAAVLPDSGGRLPAHALRFLRDLQGQARTVLFNFAGPLALEGMDSLEVIVHAYDDRSTTEDLAGQFLFGAVATTALLPCDAGPFFAMGSGIPIRRKIRIKNTIPEEVGADPFVLLKADSVINSAIYNGVFPGCQVLAAKDGKIFYHKAYGYHDYSRTQRVRLDDVYDIASVTKIAATTLMAMWSYDQGGLKLDSALKNYLPELDSSFITIKDITPKELLVHKAGLPAGLPVYKYYTYMDSVDSVKTYVYSRREDSLHSVQVANELFLNGSYMDTIWRRARCVKLVNRGSYRYSDMSMFLLKKVLERLHEKELDKFVKAYFYDPMGLKTICYHPLKRFDEERVAPTEKDAWWRRQELRGHVHDPSTALFGGVGGQAGLFSNARDLATLMQMLLDGGSYGGKQYIKEATVRKFTQRQPECHRGLGFDMQLSQPCDGKGMCCASASTRTFGHTGFTGTCVWADPDNDIVYIFLSNRVHPTSKNQKINTYRVRQAVQQIIYDALGLGLVQEDAPEFAEKAQAKDSGLVADADSLGCVDC